ncbi:peroxiredoxin-like family protein [Oleidesulfovibrio alaskensis]|jgi:peroxiredoxin|uniref:peroxiredoxin-like family protein n=1 Tax=Oleidesulfovibrio alaskensis TaxID=58180 RepID=UPI0003FC92FF|nr:peroxiredoxin-like family protein [Oleidesulfovibrio alaskensis]MBL3583656.1 AhpC/TSA family protein [Oleidesulfovibrio alaskensis]
MALQKRLDAVSRRLESQLPREIIAVMDTVATQLRLADVQGKAARQGAYAPMFSMRDMLGNVINPVDRLLQGPVLISFFRGKWCRYCIEELLELNALAAQVRQAGGSIIAVTPQLPRFNRAMAYECSLGFDVLTDTGCRMASAMGLAYQVPPAVKNLFVHFGIDLARYNGASGWHLPVTSRYVVGTDGRIACAHIDLDYSRRTPPEETLGVLRSLGAA